MSDAAVKFVKGARELPVMPPVAAEVTRKVEDPDADLKVIAQLIQRDAALALRVLKIANSSFYAMPRKVETLRQAIMLLGFSTLRSVVIAASMKDVFARFGLAERLLWEHAVAAGCAASLIAREVGGMPGEEAFVGGLVHDVGKLVMHSQAEQRYQEVMRAVYSDDADVIATETEVFGFDHAQIGFLVLQEWGLSDRLAYAVNGHHSLELAEGAEGAKPLAAVLQVADKLCLREGLGRRKPHPEIQPLECEGAELLGLRELELEDLLARFRETYDSEREVFG